MPIQENNPGLIARTIGGELLLFPACCASTPENPCGDVPEMLVTVTGSSGTINWCGETWNLPDDSGVEKSVCPTDYYLDKITGTDNGYSAIAAQERWTNTGLGMTREYNFVFVGSNWYRVVFGAFGNNKNQLTVKGYGDTILFKNSFAGQPSVPVPPTYTSTGTPQLNLIVGVSAASATYRLTDAYFGSYTTGGVTYSWAKGQGWE